MEAAIWDDSFSVNEFTPKDIAAEINLNVFVDWIAWPEKKSQAKAVN